MNDNRVCEFHDIDRADNPEQLINCLDTLNSVKSIQEYKRQTFALQNIEVGDHVLDIGCGTGDDGVLLAERVGSTGRVVGVDISEVMIAEAKGRFRNSNLPVEFVKGDAHHLSFSDNTFNSCRADRTFQHLTDPKQTLVEAVRVVRPSAKIVITDPDWETLIINAPDRTLTRKFLNFSCDSVKNGWMGRQLPSLFRHIGLVHIGVTPVTIVLTDYALANQIFRLEANIEFAQAAGVVSADETVRWVQDLREKDQHKDFFSSLTGFIVTGEKQG